MLSTLEVPFFLFVIHFTLHISTLQESSGSTVLTQTPLPELEM